MDVLYPDSATESILLIYPVSGYSPLMNGPCWHCRYFGPWRVGYYTMGREPYHWAACLRPGGVMSAQPQFGCAYFQREPGADDERNLATPDGKRMQPGSILEPG